MSSVSQKSRQICQSTEFSDMGSIAAMAHFSKGLIRRDQARNGGCAETAMARVARRLKAAPGTFANILRQRVKSVSAELRDRIVQAAFHDIEQEIARLDHEKQLLESMGIGPSQHDLDAVEAALEAARTGLARMRASR
jgi:hypothetical protein